ncbi:MAG: DEAD/DEAH box helicase [Megasphaera sp.]|jgi:ATP-dependent RNA helicase DeaD|nr:DEAD/DEAH box helicase [Megasphaera sp.]
MAKTFQSLGISPEISEMLHKQGINEPTAVQEQSIPSLFKGRDILAQAQTGTGKTYAFLLPSLQQIKIPVHMEQVLIMAPTRELAKQIADVAHTLAVPMGIDILNLIGGKTIENQLQKLHRHPHVIIGTPGRLLDHCRRNSLDLSGVGRIIVDEADQMLQAGFLEDVDTLLGLTPKRRQVLFFSATIPDKIRGLAKKHMQNPLVLNIREGSTITLENIEQRIYMVREEQKLPRLCQMITEMNPYLAIVFCNTKERTSILASQLIEKGFNIGELHGDMSQGRRTQVLRDFTKAKTQILVATDIAARGIDIEGITHVFSYDVPHDVDYYIHRIGRTGRAGNEGLSVMFATGQDENWVRRIEHTIQATITKYTANGKVKVKSNTRPPKKKQSFKDKLPISSYQSTKEKRHKSLHKGGDNRRRRRR